MARNVTPEKPERHSDETRAAAKARFSALEDFLRRTQQKDLESKQLTRLAREFAAQLNINIVTFYRLLARHVEGNGTTDALLPRMSGRKHGKKILSSNVERIISEEINEFYLSRQRPRLIDLVNSIHARCHGEGLKRPHVRTIKARIATHRADHIHRKRYGARSARNVFAPVTGKLDADRPLQIVQIDHTKVDLVIVDENSRQTIGRPWLTLGVDVHTRMVTGFYVSFDPPSTTSVAICIALSVMEKDSWVNSLGIKGEWPVHGIPESIHVDNAKEFHSKALTTACERYGIAVQYRPPATPHYGGHVERLIGTLMGSVHTLPGTTFSSVADKDAYESERYACLTLSQFERWLMLEIVGKYHQQVHRTLSMPPVEKWRQGVKEWQPRLPKSGRYLLIDFLPCEQRQVRRDGIRLFNIFYWSDALTSFQVNGERVNVHYDPRNLAKVFVRGRSGEFLDVPYRNNLGRPAISLWEHRVARSYLQKAGRSVVDERVLFETIAEQQRSIKKLKIAESSARQTVVLPKPTPSNTEHSDSSMLSEAHDSSELDDPPVITPIYRVREFND